MGEVWKARDTKLGREVAIKTLPEEFARDADRLARFEREAKLLASLNHPNIAAIHGFEEDNGTHFLVLELVQGDTLADRLARGAIPVDESLKLSLQIGKALEAAHENGVIHRDLKPANIKVTDEGIVKVLDFGLAKALVEDGANLNLSQSPTLSMAATQQGVILGTAAYMSPEQARGVEADKRADIWAFGCVLFEMLTGRQVFQGEMLSDVMASVLKTEPGFEGLPQSLHPRLHDVLRRCLEKDPKQRFRDIGDVAYELQGILADPHGLTSHTSNDVVERRRTMLPWASATGFALATIVLGLILVRNNESVPAPPVRFSVTVPLDERVVEGVGPALSDDGRLLAYVSQRDGVDNLCVRPLDAWESRCIPVTDGVDYAFFSPDGRRVGFSTGQDQLNAVDLDTGRIIEISDIPDSLGAAWHPDGDSIIINRRFNEGLWTVPATGGTPSELTIKEPDELGHLWPQVLPDGNTVIFTRYVVPIEDSRVSALRLDSGVITTLKEGVVFGRYIDSGHLLYVRFNTLWAAPFDLERLEITGAEQPVQEDVFFRLGSILSGFDVARNGTLAYIPSESERELVWVDLDGNEELVTDRRDYYLYPSLSPDGREIVYQRERGIPDIWSYDLERDAPEVLVTANLPKLDPIWTPDGTHVVSSRRISWCGICTGIQRPIEPVTSFWKPPTTSTRPRFHRMARCWSTASRIRRRVWISGPCPSKTGVRNCSCRRSMTNPMVSCPQTVTSSHTDPTAREDRRSTFNPFRRQAATIQKCPSTVAKIHSGPGTVEPCSIDRPNT